MTDDRLFPVDNDGKCRACKVRHHPGWGCPRARKRRRQAINPSHTEPHSGGQ